MPSSHFRDELRQIPDLTERARRLREIKRETTAEIRQIEQRLARDMARAGKSMADIGRAFGVSRSRAHQLVHARLSAEGRKAHREQNGEIGREAETSPGDSVPGCDDDGTT